MIQIVNKCLLAGNKFIPGLHLRQPEFSYSACKLFTKHCERIQIFREAGDSKHIYNNEFSQENCFRQGFEK